MINSVPCLDKNPEENHTLAGRTSPLSPSSFLHPVSQPLEKPLEESRIITAGTFSSALWSSSSIQLRVKTAFHGKKKLLSFHT